MSIDLGGGFVAHEIHEWGGTSAGRPTLGRVGREWLHHSVTLATANAFGDFRTLDGIGRSRGHGGVSYSELIHPTGVVGIGQGDRVGAHTGGHNSTSRGVVIICNCDQQIPTDRSIEAYHRLRDWKIRTGRLTPGTFPTGGHRDTGFATACPGQHNQSRLALFRAGSGSIAPSPEPTPEPPNYYEENEMKPLLVDIADPDDRGNHFLEREGGRWVPITKAERDLIAAAREALVLQPRNKAQAGQLGVYG